MLTEELELRPKLGTSQDSHENPTAGGKLSQTDTSGCLVKPGKIRAHTVTDYKISESATEFLT